jgi:hypothetical protein
MIELVEGFWVDPWDVKVIKTIDEKSCSLWVSGQSATDGFVIPYPAEEVVQAIIDEREKDGEVEDDDDQDEE